MEKKTEQLDYKPVSNMEELQIECQIHAFNPYTRSVITSLDG